MTSSNPAQVRACASLSPTECDAIFFPGSGGKPTKAKELCATCPFIKACLTEAIELQLDGFFAGTTLDERRMMLHHFHRKVTPITEVVIMNLPKSAVVARRVYRKIQPPALDTLGYLDTLVGPVL